jgi:hypothetical protein
VEKFRRILTLPSFWLLSAGKIDNLNRFEFKVYSQNGEDGILQAIFSKIGSTNAFCVEFGVHDGTECNTRFLREKQGWSGLWMDGGRRDSPLIMREFITAQNINMLFQKYRVPKAFDLLSIDIDGNDYWVWKALSAEYSPRVVVVEYNAKIPPTESKTIEPAPDFHWDGTDYFGASLLALTKLAQEKGYTLVGCNQRGINAFFARNDLAEKYFKIKPITALYRPPTYGKTADGGGWPTSARKMITV